MSTLNENDNKNENPNLHRISYISIDRVGAQNPVYTNNEIYNLEAPTEQLNQPRFSIDSEDEINNEFRSVKYANIMAQEIDILCCNNVYSIKTRTYVNIKKTLKMLLPVFVLIVLILVLVFFFKIDLIFED